jgi:hypothetical protein
MLSRYPDRYKGTRPSSKGNLIDVFGSNQQLIQSADRSRFESGHRSQKQVSGFWCNLDKLLLIGLNTKSLHCPTISRT